MTNNDYICNELVRMSHSVLEKDTNNNPFTAAIVQESGIIVLTHNKVLQNNDPTAHAEIVAIREASTKLGVVDLTGYDLYSNCEPCPMCLAAAYWSNIRNVYYLNSMSFVSQFYEDSFILEEIKKDHAQKSKNVQQINFPTAQEVFLIKDKLLNNKTI